MVLHTVGPQSMGEDEHKIGRAYQTWLAPFLGAIPLAVAYFNLELKWVIAVSASLIILQLHEAGGRLHDLCIRLRRTNILLIGRPPD